MSRANLAIKKTSPTRPEPKSFMDSVEFTERKPRSDSYPTKSKHPVAIALKDITKKVPHRYEV